MNQYRQIVGTVWAIDSDLGQIVKLDSELNLVWNTTLVTYDYPYITLRDIVAGPDWKIYVVGREGESAGWWENSANSHAFSFCVTGDGNPLWSHTFDAGGPSEEERGVADGVACSPDGTETYVGATLSYSETDWNRSLSVLAYGKTNVDTAATFRVEASTGDVHADGIMYADDFRTGSADIAEWVYASEPVEPGDVVEHDPLNPGCYRRSSDALSSLIAGVVSTEPGVVLGDGSIEGERALLALTGIVPVKVTDEGGPIEAGDLLVASSTPGHAMRWSGDHGYLCTLVGKALEPMTGSEGVILVLLTAH
jgi:hypothetical protein